MSALNSPFGHPRWGLQFYWWAVDPLGCVGLFYSAFGAVPSAANAHTQVFDEATALAKTRYPEWFDAYCPHDEYQPHCVIELARGPYLFMWDEVHDDRYTQYGVPGQPTLLSELPVELKRAALLVKVGFIFDETPQIQLSYPEEKEVLSAM
ncbi:hypothetical protein ABT294_50065 [Nonomuraea sp. NPDC000554]|uniref:hypothetical protein n=1 Tax=Nonomuraea sp. NPDC000554 TaxID=3154259 RepID=UPI00331F0004